MRSLYCRGPVLATHPAAARRAFLRLASRAGVVIHERSGVAAVEPGLLRLEGGGEARFDECLWCTQAEAAGWLAATGLPLDAEGFIRIDEHLAADGGPPGVFACGDVASSRPHPRPKAGVYAVRQVQRARGAWGLCQEAAAARARRPQLPAARPCHRYHTSVSPVPLPPASPPRAPPPSTPPPPGPAPRRKPAPPPDRPAAAALRPAVHQPQPHHRRRPLRDRHQGLGVLRGRVGVDYEGQDRPGLHGQVWS
jgi:hypothetical protein